MKNNKGFFLAETIVMIALVTTIMAFVYPNVSKLYENYKNRVMYYDQTEDLYALRAIYEIHKGKINDETKKAVNGSDVIGCNYSLGMTKIDGITEINELEEIYIASYMSNLSDTTNFNFNRYLKRIKKSTNDQSAYRLVGVFGVDGKTRYASIKIDNPNPTRNCTNGG